ncbi:hypothetical protein [Nocardia australiensis]|uniref:hypothetical protein n=1 Tax=Nocardia australiensis TaxID=2887191 RepID=UPI001D1340D0|nr:hypothetical protein [Nocardia australiensis]
MQPTMTAAALPRDEAHHPYGIAVTDALVCAGLTINDVDYGGGEDRDMCFELAETHNGEEFVVGWSEREGWSWVSRKPASGFEPTGYGWFDLPNLTVPEAVAAAIREQLGFAPIDAGPAWTPPPGYNPAIYSAGNETVEPGLAAYLLHPAWVAQRPK